MTSDQFQSLYRFVESKTSAREFRAIVDALGDVILAHLQSDKKKRAQTEEGGEQ